MAAPSSLPGLPQGAEGRPELLLPYQKRAGQAILDGQLIVVEKSRRIGLTWGIAPVMVTIAGAAKAAGGQNVFYMGTNFEMTEEFIDYCAGFTRALALGAPDIGEELVEDPDRPDRSFSMRRLAFASGFKILALPSRARTLRGRQGILVLDEAAFIDDLEAVLKAALAFIMWGGKVVVVSTHNTDQNPFNGLIQEIRSGRRPGTVIRIDLDDALRDGLYRRICEMKGNTWSPEAEAAWRANLVAFYGDGADEELFCIPRTGGGAWLPLAWLEACVDPAAMVIRRAWEAGAVLTAAAARERDALLWCETELAPALAGLSPHDDHVVGVDYGAKADLTAIWVLAVTRQIEKKTRLVLELRACPDSDQQVIVGWLVERLPRFAGMRVDATGAGTALGQAMASLIGDEGVAVNLSVGWYRESMPPVKGDIQDRAMSLPADADILDDLRMIEDIDGAPRVPKDKRRDGRDGQSRHGDTAIAAVLAHAAARARSVMPKISLGGRTRAGGSPRPYAGPRPDRAYLGRL